MRPAHPCVVSAIVLAAGGSTRMGRPKAALRIANQSFVARCIRLATPCRRCFVVQGAAELSSLVNPSEATLVHNDGWADGPLTSLQLGLRHAATEVPDLSGVLVLTVDRPHIHPSTVAALLKAHVHHPHRFVAPQYGERRGHPVIWPRAAFDALLALGPSQTPRQLLTGPHAMPRSTVVVDDPAVLDNIDTPDDLAALQQRGAEFDDL